MPVPEYRTVEFRVEPWVNAYIAWANERPSGGSIDLLDAFKAGWDAAEGAHS